uniref:Uncharacterized protein n=1 Tax=candidate division CPR3 bacterium TaxID=2268181 RepID=A0A7V3J9B9_UNCC3
MVEKKVNPYGKLGDVNVAGLKDLDKICFGKGGVMFKLFDLGKLCMSDNKRLWVYKNEVGSLLRSFVDKAKNGGYSQNDIDGLAIELSKVGKLALVEKERVDVFEEKVKKILEVLCL